MKTGAFRCLIVPILLATLSSEFSLASDDCRTLNIAAAEIPYFIEDESKGAFVDLVRTTAKRAKLDVNIKVYPKRRALNLFQMGQVNALLPHSSAGQELPSYKSTPILIKRDFVFVRKGSPIPRSIKDLEGLQIGLTKQYAYSKDLTSNTKIIFSRAPNSDLENIKMLSIGRIDGSIIEERSGLKAIADAKTDNIDYDRNNPINEFLVWMLFSKDGCGLELSNKINSEFASMKSDGIWESILAPPKSGS